LAPALAGAGAGVLDAGRGKMTAADPERWSSTIARSL
jgi:hypothetical protein